MNLEEDRAVLGDEGVTGRGGSVSSGLLVVTILPARALDVWCVRVGDGTEAVSLSEIRLFRPRK